MRDALIQVAHPRGLAARIPDAVLHEFAEGGHNIHRSHAEACHQQVREIIAQMRTLTALATHAQHKLKAITMTTIEQRLTQLEQEVGELKDGQALRTVLSQYAIAVDDQRPELLRTLFTDDARVHIPAWQVDVNGVDAVMAFYDQYWTRFAHPRRYFANDDTRINGDTATVFMYWHVTQESGDSSVLGWGTYHWQFHRVAGQWRIASVLIAILAMTTVAAGWAGERKFTDS